MWTELAGGRPSLTPHALRLSRVFVGHSGLSASRPMRPQGITDPHRIAAVTFEVEYLEELASGSEWKPVGEADAVGDQAAREAVGQVVELAGWYRTRIKDQPDEPWTFCHVSLHPQTG